ncbi:DUF4190 domain-containing protein [Myceligenerans xiligouense]|uniref:Uncharacterized protein DUF4190 n=1 Tax=Myceligenerans xiligouense TaxID=253184 RepID=A0A3N4Z753_9MICO|nr:DUF4190 domain-containing protein [Myceligenerans xiligouense]RPF21132.1 uncharacterized protein DUF4190 [Myceligenerans xiligouense]
MSMPPPGDLSPAPDDHPGSGHRPAPYGRTGPISQPYQGPPGAAQGMPPGPPPAAPPPVPYGGPQYGYVMPMPQNELGLWSLVTGILSWVVCPLVLGVVAIVTGHAGMKAVREGKANNAGAATAGLILGWLNVAMVAGGLLLWLIFGVAMVGVAGLGSLLSAG